MDKVLVGIPDDLQAVASAILNNNRGVWLSTDNRNHRAIAALIQAGYLECKLRGDKCFIRPLPTNQVVVTTPGAAPKTSS